MLLVGTQLLIGRLLNKNVVLHLVCNNHSSIVGVLQYAPILLQPCLCLGTNSKYREDKIWEQLRNSHEVNRLTGLATAKCSEEAKAETKIRPHHMYIALRTTTIGGVR